MLWSTELSGLTVMVWNPDQPSASAGARVSEGRRNPASAGGRGGQTTATYLSWFNPQAAYRIKPIGR